MRDILVISPHPDDEALGCGGALAAHSRASDRVHVVFLTSGEQGGAGEPPDVTLGKREREARSAARILGIHRVEFWREPDGGLKASAKLARRLTDTLDRVAPAVVYGPHPDEAHADHRAASMLLRRVLTEAGKGLTVTKVLLYEVWTPLARFDRLVDITDTIEQKMEAIRAYESQSRLLPFAEAFRGLSRYRGALHNFRGGPFAEVFLTLKRKTGQKR